MIDFNTVVTRSGLHMLPIMGASEGSEWFNQEWLTLVDMATMDDCLLVWSRETCLWELAWEDDCLSTIIAAAMLPRSESAMTPFGGNGRAELGIPPSCPLTAAWDMGPVEPHDQWA